MTRTEELQKGIDEANKERTSKDQWYLLILTDIAYSLAVIADKMTEGEKDDQNTLRCITGS